ncbi:MAG: ABC transporter permease [Rhodospirillales bacterium]|nr:ABC transporter permease [Rhodospirillales bacterium]
MGITIRRLLRRPLTALGIVLVLVHLTVALIAPSIVPFDPFKLLDAPLEPPGTTYWLGTDELGRDFLSRLLMGGRIAIVASLAAGFIATLGGGLLGLAMAYYRGPFDDVVSRIVEMKLAIPSILFVSLFVTGFGQSLAVLVFVMAVIKMMGVIRTVRAQGIVLMEQGYVKVAQMRGEHGPAIILREMLPNVADLLTVEFALRTSSALLLVSALSFLGLGLSPPTPDWGLMIHDGLQSIRSEPWLILAPALCISTLVIGLNFATEGIADAVGLEAARGVAGH